MKIIGVSGWSGAGMTTLSSDLIPRLPGQGLCVSVIQHAHYDFEADERSKD